MPSSTVEQIKSRLDIVTLIGTYVKLSKAGRHFKGLSPFSNEKTPSFFVSPEKGLFYCFSSGKGGDIFTFIEEIEGVDFQGALKILAERAGVPIVYESSEKRSERERLYTLLEDATGFFEGELIKSLEAKKYLSERKVFPETQQAFRIGYAADSWRSLYDFLIGKKYAAAEIERVGLIKRGEEGTFYDTFRDRIIFPIADIAGRIVAFSGRILHPNDQSPKYLNSPDTLFFNKSETLYGLSYAKAAIRKADFAVLVEGQMDLVMSHQAGVTNTVATSGTSLTLSHLKNLQKISNRVIMAFDPDRAGTAASLRGADLALGAGMEVKVASLPEGKDPADLVKEKPKAWVEVLSSSKHLIDFYLEKLLERSSGSRNLGKEVKQFLLPYLRLLSSAIEQSHFIKEISTKTGIKEDALWEDLKHTKPKEIAEEAPPIKIKTLPVSPRELLVGLHHLLKGVSASKPLALHIKKMVTEAAGESAWSDIEKEMSGKEEKLSIQASELYDTAEVEERDINPLVTRVLHDFFKQKYMSLGEELEALEKAGDEKRFQEVLRQCQEVREKIDTLGRDL